MTLLALAAAVLWAAAAGRALAEPAPGLATLRTYCAACHQPTASEPFARVSSIRKTPEGWLMTIVRMQQLHGVQLPDGARETLVAYLADTQGLAPSETAGARFALERRPNVPDLTLPGELQVMCARCHSAARIALQRRDAADWLKHVHWHLAQWPTIEYHQSARDRLWWQTATTVVPEQLGQLFPLHSAAWTAWQAKPHADLAGTWLVHGRQPGRGDYLGTAEISRNAAGDYSAVYSLDYEDGGHVEGSSHALVYTGFEWRGRARLGPEETREVFAVSEDGQSLSGRWFNAAHSEDGADLTAVRAGAGTQIVAVSPAAIRTGSSARVTILGSGLDGAVSFGAGTRSRVVGRGPHTLTVEVAVAAAAAPGYRTVTVGGASAAGLLALYDRVDRIEVTPGFGIARLGGGKIDPVTAQFEAIAYRDLPGAGGKTEAVRLGALPVSWSVEPFNDEARRAEDVKFAGTLDATGRFLPASAGPNPARKFSANNAGNLAIVATLKDAGKPVSARAHLLVTVQRWNTPPIY
jgi:quinohemoprotein amine dehydrogenase